MTRAFWFCIAACLAYALPEKVQAEGLVEFIRGDSDASGQVDLSDGIATLQYLFLGEKSLPCLQAADTSNDSVLDIADAIMILSFLFLGGSKPDEPYPSCGYSLALENTLSCESFPPCDKGTEVQDIDKNTIRVTPEMFWALNLLAEGEPLEVLKDIPGYEEFLANGPQGGEIKIRQYQPTIRVSTPKEIFFELGDEIFNIIDAEIKNFGLDPEFTVRDIYAEDSPREFPIDILVYLENDVGEGRLRGGRVIDEDPKTNDPVDVEVTPPKKCSDDMQCYWASTIDIQPSAPENESAEKVWNKEGKITRDDESHFHGAWPREKGGGAHGWKKQNGFGPWHELIAVRHSKSSCKGPETDIMLSASGVAYAMASVYCQIGGVNCDVPEDCTSTVSGAATYTSSVKTHANVFGECENVESAMKIWAQDSAMFSANDENVFSKSLEIQNEPLPFNSTDYVELRERDRGRAANPNATDGHELISAPGGRQNGDLVAYGSATVDAPANFYLAGSGMETVQGSGNASGGAQITTGVMALYFAGTSDCPGAGATHGGYVWGDRASQDAEKKKAAEFMKEKANVAPDWKPGLPGAPGAPK